jgi:HK97 gp10 family phage protein
VRNTAVQSINQGAKSGVVYDLYNPRRTHKASAAGEPPATDTDFLASNIVLDVDADGLGASVESRADYSSFLEFGTSKMAARPFMQPALEENKPKIKRLAKQMIKAK